MFYFPLSDNLTFFNYRRGPRGGKYSLLYNQNSVITVIKNNHFAHWEYILPHSINHFVAARSHAVTPLR